MLRDRIENIDDGHRFDGEKYEEQEDGIALLTFLRRERNARDVLCTVTLNTLVTDVSDGHRVSHYIAQGLRQGCREMSKSVMEFEQIGEKKKEENKPSPSTRKRMTFVYNNLPTIPEGRPANNGNSDSNDETVHGEVRPR